MDTQPTWKSGGRLADGREIVYFDEMPGLGRAQARDRRPLPPRPPGPPLPAGTAEWGIRWDPLAGEPVVIAARQDRTFLPPAGECPLDPSGPGRHTEIPADSYDVVVFENRFPSLADPLGRCEVVCFTSDHGASFTRLSPRRVRTVLEAWADRTSVLSALPGTRQVYCFENRGEEIGVTLHHPHGQIYALPFVAPRLAQMVAQAGSYAREHPGGNLFDDLVAAELGAGVRIVTGNEHWVVFVPQAARWPFEVRIFPAARVPDLTGLGEAARESFGPLYLDVLRRFDALFGRPAPYIAAWHQAPVGDSGARREFAAQLAAAGHEITVLDDLSTGFADAVPPGAALVRGTLRECAAGVLAGGVDAVLHFAAKSLVGESVADPATYWPDNLGGTISLLEAMRETRGQKTPSIVASSTAAVYGEPERTPILETDPTSPYGASKQAVDTALAEFARLHALGAVSLRYFNVAGAEQAADGGWLGERHHPETHLIPNVLAAVTQGRRVQIFGDDYPPRTGPACGTTSTSPTWPTRTCVRSRPAGPASTASTTSATGTASRSAR